MTDKQTVKFGDICREVKLTTKDPIADGYERYIGLEHLDSGSLKIKRWGMIAEDNPSFTRVFKKGHILFGKRRPYLRKVGVAEFDGICSSDIIVMEPDENGPAISELLPFIVQSEIFWDHAIRTSSGSLSPRTKFSALRECLLELPCMKRQADLVKVLLKLEGVLSKSEKTISSVCMLLNKVISDAMNGLPVLSLEQLKSLKVKDVAKLHNGRAYKLSEWEESGTPVIRLQNLTGSGEKYYYSNMMLAPEKYCNKGDLLYMWSATFGPYIWSGEKAIYHYHIWKVECDETVIRKMYMFYLLKYFTSLWMDKSNGMGILHITKGTMENTEIKIPDVEIQDQLLSRIEKAESTYASCNEKHKNILRLKSSIISECVKKG